jgi:UDP-N-acetylmuramyl pentapeptide synthase
MSRSLALFAIGLIFGGGAGFVLAAANGVTFDGHDHSDPAHHGGDQAETAAHDHSATINVPAGPTAPSVKIAVVKDPMAGWNLHVLPQNFEFAPESASAADQLGEGRG